MRKRVAIAAGGFLLVILGTLGWRLLAPHEPVYGGKALSQWLACLDGNNPGSDSPVQAVIALRAIGPSAFPWLARMIRTTDPAWKQAVLNLNAKQSLIRFPLTPASTLRAEAVEGYTILGGLAARDVPNLIRMMESEPSPQVRCCIEAALGGIGPGAKAAIPVLEKSIGDPNPQVRRGALLALANIRMFAPGDVLR